MGYPAIKPKGAGFEIRLADDSEHWPGARDWILIRAREEKDRAWLAWADRARSMWMWNTPSNKDDT